MTTTPQQIPSASEKRTAHRPSKDGKWRSFSRVPHLLQYVSSGPYFARIKMAGKIIRGSLETEDWLTAQLRLLDFLKAKQEANQPDQKQKVLFVDALGLYRMRIENDPSMKARSKGVSS